jgi:SNF2 family DNA or RNA helicase
VRKLYEFVRPGTDEVIEAYPLQERDINRLAPLDRSGWYDEVGTGKTLMATVVALYKKILFGNLTVVLMPPILIPQWYRWLRSVRRTPITVAMYRGTPKQRREINLNVDFALMSYGIFKNDFESLCERYEHRPVTVIADEATAIKNVGTDNFKCVRDFGAGRTVLPLTGTPLSTPADAYAYVKTVSPTVYRNQRHFEALHVAERDFFEKVTKWSNLEFMRESLLTNSSRILKKDIHPDLGDPIIVPIDYELDDKHLKLYNKLADEQLLLLEDGGKIDATSATRLYNALQQIICNPGHFSGDDMMRSAAHDLLDMVLEEIGAGNKENAGKLIVLANYKMTNRGLMQYLQPYGAVACFSDIPPKRMEANIRRFVDDPSCRVLHGNPISFGYGLDELKQVCWDMLVLEAPIVPKDFWQAVGRLWRDGQVKPPTVRIAKALDTIQQRLFKNLLTNDALVNSVQGGWKNLRDAIHGG